ncbi:hypothetical protein L2E82_13857 [Cichorium intybus]|uniref:Uncharacterized protein n=1 Tax=Cichorium intybus TaxID=13427 RepID=A0ACB9EY21_CICIN|nr:hypothetical protein L1887_33504 [Cichorium endivia]KAI3763859.1 hypothetical protein L2E82_13857 [Cichorium intybus]
MESLSSKKRVLINSDESESNSVKPKRIRDDLLDILQDSDVSTASSDLDSFMKRFEDEISEPTESIADRESASGESRPDLGFLFEASDDELGLPPTDLTPAESEKTGVSVELGEVWWLDDQISSYDSFEYEFGYSGEDAVISSFDDIEYVALDGLFDCTDLGFGLPELPSQPETMPSQ